MPPMKESPVEDIAAVIAAMIISTIAKTISLNNKTTNLLFFFTILLVNKMNDVPLTISPIHKKILVNNEKLSLLKTNSKITTPTTNIILRKSLFLNNSMLYLNCLYLKILRFIP